MTSQERAEYLEDLSEEFGVPLFFVETLADMLGDSELFDGLVTELEDARDEGRFPLPEPPDEMLEDADRYAL